MTIYLYVKQHRVTNLKYFGMTTKDDPYKYMGSGQHWLRHLKVHGRNVETTHLWEFENYDDSESFALHFSEENRIVESKEWANIRPEHGRQGRPVGSPGLKGEKNPSFGKCKELNSFYGKKHTPENMELFRQRGLSQPSGGLSPKAKRIITPIGEFDCQKDAAKALGISDGTLLKRLKQKSSGYNYL